MFQRSRYCYKRMRGDLVSIKPGRLGHLAQPADLLRRRERPGQAALLGDLRQPGGVQLVGLGPPGQRLDLRRLVQGAVEALPLEQEVHRLPVIVVDSMPAFSTCQARSQSASASSSLRVVPNSRVSCCRPPFLVSLGTRIVTMTAALPMSIPATRSQNSGSSPTSSIAISNNERAVKGRGRPQELGGKRKSDPRARSTSAQPSRTAPGAQTAKRDQARQGDDGVSSPLRRSSA